MKSLPIVAALLLAWLCGWSALCSPAALAGDTSLSADHILPLIRTKSYLQKIEDTAGANSKSHLIREELAGDLEICFVFDLPGVTKFIDEETIAALAIDRKTLLETAIANLRKITPKPIIESDKELAFVHDGGTYQSSLLLIGEFWNSKTFPYHGDLVVFLVSRDVTLVTGSEEPEGLAAAGDFARDMIAKEPFPMTAQPIVRRNGKWQNFLR